MKNLTQKNWIVISLAGFTLFVMFFFLLMVYGKELSLSTPSYFFLVIIIALVSTGFLAGAMKSIARYDVTYQNKSLMLAGPAVIFFIILYFGIEYKPVFGIEPLTLSVLVKQPGESVISGSVRIRVGEYNAEKKLDSEGIALFQGISQEYKGDNLDLLVISPGFLVKDTSLNYTLSSTSNYTNITLNMLKKQYSLSVSGRVIQLPERLGVAGANVEFAGVNKIYSADSTGRFTAVLPLGSGASTRVIVNVGAREIYNSLRTINENEFLTIPVSN